MPLPFRVIDAFADRPFTGNPAAVVLLDHDADHDGSDHDDAEQDGSDWPSSVWMQSVAMEMNLSETSFLKASGEGYGLRWFTPSMEVDLCGHATLAAAAALADMGKLDDGETVAFDTRSGRLQVQRHGDQYLLDFPVVIAEQTAAPEALLPALGVRSPRSVYRNKFDYLIELASQSDVAQLRPDFAQLATVDCRGIIVTATSDDDRYDFVSRFFAPAAGINEDPVTGSAHCSLVDYWSKRLGKQRLVGHQISLRGGVVSMQLMLDRVILGGRGHLFSRGTLDSPGSSQR